MVAPTPIIVDDISSPPPRKRLRQDNSVDTSAKSNKEPRLFVPFRALGLITNHIPFVLQTRSHKGATDGPRIHILTCLGRSWALWEGGKMSLLFVGPDAPEHISSMAMDGNAVWVSSGIYAVKYIRGKEVLRVSNPLGTNLSFITIFGSQLLALNENGDRMLLWNTSDGELESTIVFDANFSATSVLHPATYLNKVVVASSQGSMQLWNTRTQTCIHQYPATRLLSSPNLVASGSKNQGYAVTALVQSPAIDVVGIGFTSGEISVYDVRADERLMRMFMEGGGVRALGFRSDGHPILASASSAGHIALWDLNEGGRLLRMIRGAHDAAITGVEWVPGQPVLITSSEDNSVKQWLFESPTSAPRLLKFRSGHQTPPHLIQYYADDGKQLLTASRDRSLRCTSVVRDSRSFELSQGSLIKKATSLSIPLASLKFPPITSISYSSARSKDWDDIITAHTDETFARTWTMQGKRLGKYSFGFVDDLKAKGKERNTVGAAKAVCVTACGNFGLAGSSTGQIHMWNMQSGIKRKSYTMGPCPPEVAARFYSGSAKRSERSVTGLATDSLNRVVVASTLDGTINFFDFQTTKLEHTLVLPSTAVSILLHRDSGLLAVICDDMVVRIIDIETRRVVRELTGFHGRILDITFSPDSRWLVVTSLDSVIRTFDVPTGRLIDAFRTSSIATSISFSPTNDFLATAHVDSVGIFLWANRAQYADVSFQSVSDSDIFDVSLPSMQGVEEDEALEALTALKVSDAPVDVFSTPPQLDGELITLTLLPRSRWQTLLNLEIIQQRNKPKEPPKAPEQAPFFLPTLPGVETRFAPEVKEPEKEPKRGTRRLEKAKIGSDSVFCQKLAAELTDGDYEGFFNFAKMLSPAALDLELRSLVTLDNLSLFITALTQRLLSHRDFEAVQAMQNVFLRMHGDVLIGNPQMRQELEKLVEVQQKESESVLELITSSLGTLGFVRDTL
ncbi:Utp21-domain-containing protein [Flammula alnicola]|nr:Utp21-domain-containing protein [Flammula alnicola]